MNPSTTYAYDSRGNETSQTDALHRVTTFGYDAYGNQTSRTLPDVSGAPTATESEQYDALNRVTRSVDFDGNVATYAYNTLGQLTKMIYMPGPGSSASTETVTYTYDALGRQTLVNDSVSGVTSYSYDSLGNVTSVASPKGTVNHAYDPATGQLIRTWTSDGAIDESFAYDALGRLSTVTVTKQLGTTTDQITAYAYDAAGNLVSTSTADGTGPAALNTTYAYDDLNRLTLLTNFGGSAALSSYSYQYDASGHQTHVVETQRNQPTRTIDYAYDHLYRLTSEVDTVGSATTSYSYAYDLVGNRQSQTINGVTTNFNYDARDRLTSQGGGITYDYDPNGSELDEKRNGTVIQSFTYDARNRQISAYTASTGITETYVYDDNGNRVTVTDKSVTKSSTTQYEFDNASPTGYPQVLAETQNGAFVAAYAYGSSRISEANGTGTHVYLYDAHGSVRQLASTNGQVTDRYTYDAFGNLIASQSLQVTVNPYQYTAMRFDAATGVYDDAARYYVPAVGRFASQDGYMLSPGDLNNANLYVYVGGNPLNMTDPTGHDGLVDTLGALAIQGLLNGLRLGAIGGVAGAGIGAIDAALGGQDIVQGAIGGAKFGGALGFGLGFLGPFATTFLAPSVITGLLNMGAGASLAIGAYGAGSSYVDGHTVQALFRLGLAFVGYSFFRVGATAPLKPVNIGGEGEVPNVINLQPRSALGKNFGRATDGKSLAGMIQEGNEFLIYNADTGVLPFKTGSVPKIITNGVPIDTPPGGLFKPICSAEIMRVLKPGGQWVRDGVVVYTKPQ